MIIDIHAHLGSWFDFLLPEPSAEWHLEVAERIGVGVSGISHLDGFGFDARGGNERAIAAAEGADGKLAVWLVVNPYQDDLDRIREQLDHPHVWGLKLHPDVQQYPVTGPRYEPYLQAAESVGATVLSHGETRSPFNSPAQLAEIARRHPGSAVLLGHAGLLVDGVDHVGELAASFPNLYAEFCGSLLTHHFLERLVDVAGAGKVVFGSDACFLDQRWGVGRVLYSDLPEDTKAKVLYGNARRILGHRFTEELQ